MTKIRNTTADMRSTAAQMGLLAEAAVTGSAETFILGQERAGQHELVHSDRLPSDCRDREAMEALGFTFGNPDPDDPLFMPARLPLGWSRKAGEHSMGSTIVDELGRVRVTVFYKAAYYDRKAHMSLIGLHWYVTCAVEYDGPEVIFDETWATREAVIAAMRAERQRHADEAAEFRGYAAQDSNRDERNRSRCAEIADEKDAKVALYDARIAAMED